MERAFSLVFPLTLLLNRTRQSNRPAPTIHPSIALPTHATSNNVLSHYTRCRHCGCMKSNRFRLPDGRSLCWCTFGNPSASTGRTVLYFHGYLSSRLEAAILHEDAEELGVSIIAFDRPGYGRSSTDSARSYASVAQDAIHLLDELIPSSEQVVLMGVSGGAPYAFMCASLLKGRVKKLILNVPFYPVVGQPELIEEMNAQGKRLLRDVIESPFKVKLILCIVWILQKLPFCNLLLRGGGFSQQDLRMAEVHSEKYKRLAKGAREGTRRGISGAFRDLQLMADSGLNPGAVQNISCEVAIWVGDKDQTTPMSMGKMYKAKFDKAKINIMKDMGHLLGFSCGKQILEL